MKTGNWKITEPETLGVTQKVEGSETLEDDRDSGTQGEVEIPDESGDDSGGD